MNKSSISCAVYFLMILFLTSCDRPDSGHILELKRGQDSFFEEFSRLKDPRGILPDTFGLNGAEIKTVPPVDYYEYFAYDRKCVLILLSVEPVCFAVIRSGDFFHALEYEREQLASGTSPAEKSAASFPFFRRYGGLSLALMFIPNEIRLSANGSLMDIGSSPSISPSLLYRESHNILFYTPEFREESLYNEFLSLIDLDRRVVEFTRSASFSEDFDCQKITWYEKQELTAMYSVIAGTDVDSEGEEGSYEDVHQARGDFIFITSVPFGNSAVSGDSYYSVSGSPRHGISLLLRGETGPYYDFLEEDGISLSIDEKLPLSVVISDSYTGPVYIDWGEKRNVILRLSYSTPKDDRAEEFFLNTSGWVLQNPDRGRLLTVELHSPDTGDLLASSSYYLTDIVFSEVCYWGSSFYGEGTANSDDFIEIRNISVHNVDLSLIDIDYLNTRLNCRFWCGVSHNEIEGYSSDSYCAPDRILFPGEHIVLYTKINGNSSRLFHENNYGMPAGGCERGSISKVYIGKGYTLRIHRGGRIIHSLHIDGSFGGKNPYRSMVLDRSGSWRSCIHDSGSAAGPAGGQKNYATPGFSAGDEL